MLETGAPLTSYELELARSVGVEHPERVRLKIVPAIPLPKDAELRAAALQAQLMGPSTSGVTLRYGIYPVGGLISDRLKRHECRHVCQYERAGSIMRPWGNMFRRCSSSGTGTRRMRSTRERMDSTGAVCGARCASNTSLRKEIKADRRYAARRRSRQEGVWRGWIWPHQRQSSGGLRQEVVTDSRAFRTRVREASRSRGL